MSAKPYSYTNRQGKTAYFRAMPTKKGGLRYYLTHQEDAENLITEIRRAGVFIGVLDTGGGCAGEFIRQTNNNVSTNSFAKSNR
ncbi:MAG: hypothetical protein DHS20C18_41190 [Saprospiraceae bacterium]|nr:MAG: hypothetical protein DHS20C18_41190 [Saprospiraceae bacterium]